ncbi:MAG: hypothetical protein WDN25_10155 [Acetobacteraceae bacterium]
MTTPGFSFLLAATLASTALPASAGVMAYGTVTEPSGWRMERLTPPPDADARLLPATGVPFEMLAHGLLDMLGEFGNRQASVPKLPAALTAIAQAPVRIDPYGISGGIPGGAPRGTSGSAALAPDALAEPPAAHAGLLRPVPQDTGPQDGQLRFMIVIPKAGASIRQSSADPSMARRHGIAGTDPVLWSAFGGAALLSLVGVWSRRPSPPRRGGFRSSRFWRRCVGRIYGAQQLVDVDAIDIDSCLPADTLIRGVWSPALVRRLLGRPDYVVLDPQGLRQPLLFYDRHRVAKVQAGAQFRQHLVKIEAENARTAAKIRRWVVLCQIEAATIGSGVSDARRDGAAAAVPPAVPPPAPAASAPRPQRTPQPPPAVRATERAH